MSDSTTVRLTQQVKAGGCASKLAPGSVAAVLSRLPKQSDPNLLVGFDTSDDAGIYRIAQDLALVQTVDFFTPLVDDPFTFGEIAATNALSDIYAMGGRPITALSIVCFPQDGDLDVLEQIMRGGLTKMEEANCIVVGGHSVRDTEIKFGYAVTGLIHPDRVFTNTGAVEGDILILTKPIGTGVITTALKRGVAKQEWVANAVCSMTTLNRVASDVITAATAVHVGTIRAGLLANREFAECISADAPGSRIPDDLRTLLYDPQTAGGLLISVAPENEDEVLGSLRSTGLNAARIGSV